MTEIESERVDPELVSRMVQTCVRMLNVLNVTYSEATSMATTLLFNVMLESIKHNNEAAIDDEDKAIRQASIREAFLSLASALTVIAEHVDDHKEAVAVFQKISQASVMDVRARQGTSRTTVN